MPDLRCASLTTAATPRGGPAASPAQETLGAADQARRGPLSVTSHSLSLSTRAFSVDFSWSRVENEPAASRGQAPAPAAKPVQAAGTAPARQPRPAQSFAEVLRRQQLAGLLMVTPPPPRDAVLLWGAEAPAKALPGPVCRAYSQSQGPLAQSSLLYSA